VKIMFNNLNVIIKSAVLTCFLILITAVLTLNISAADNICGDDATWSYDSATKTLTIKGNGELYGANYYNNLPWNEHQTEIRHIVIENGITSIGYSLFEYHPSVETISLPDTLTRIEAYAFGFYSSNIEEITIPKNVEYIGESVFIYSDNIKNLYVDEKNQHFTSVAGILYNKNQTELYYYPSGRTEANYSIGSPVKTIKSDAFTSNSFIKEITIQSSVEIIESNSFFNLANLTTVNIGENVWNIGRYAITACNNLKFINVDSNNKAYICDKYGVLYDKEKSKLLKYPTGSDNKSYDVPDSVIYIMDGAFHYAKLEEINLSDNLHYIGAIAFNSCNNLKQIIIPKSVEVIGNKAFFDCNNFELIIFRGRCL